MQFKPTLNDTLCNYPFTELALKDWSNNGKMRTAAVCCNMLRPGEEDPLRLGDVEHMTIEQIWNHPNLRRLRKDLKDGIKNPACETCWKMEEQTGTSYRLNSYQHHIDLEAESNSPKIQIIDLTTGDACNLRCQMCSPGTSNQLRIDLQNFHKMDYDYKHWDRFGKHLEPGSQNKTLHQPDIHCDQWKELKANLPTIKSIKATGGETLVATPFLDLVDHAITTGHAEHISLDFTTNATKFTKKNIERFSKFKKMIPTLSIDAVGSTYEYIRWGASWEKVDNNIRYFISSLQNIESLHVNYVLTSYNVLSILETAEYFEKIAIEYNLQVVFHIDLVFPMAREIDVRHLPNEILNKALSQIEKTYKLKDNLMVNVDKAQSYIERYCKKEDLDQQVLEKFFIETQMFDFSRNRHYKNYLKNDLVELLDNLEKSVCMKI